jgi:hypothetical protein
MCSRSVASTTLCRTQLPTTVSLPPTRAATSPRLAAGSTSSPHLAFMAAPTLALTSSTGSSTPRRLISPLTPIGLDAPPSPPSTRGRMPTGRNACSTRLRATAAPSDVPVLSLCDVMGRLTHTSR